MKISGNDIRKQDFRKAFRGYDTADVDAFLATVSSHYDRLASENNELSSRIRELTSDVNIYKENEMSLQKAIVKSQDLAEEIIQTAKKKSDNIIKEAELDCRKIKQNVDEEIMNKKMELEEIKARNEKLISDIKNFLSDKLNETEEFAKNKTIYKMELSQNSHNLDEKAGKGFPEDQTFTRITRGFPTSNDNYKS
jgi:cell division initiation protein